MSNARITLKSTAGQSIQELVTSTQGAYEFASLNPNTYRIAFEPPAGFDLAIPAELTFAIHANSVLEFDVPTRLQPKRTETPTATSTPLPIQSSTPTVAPTPTVTPTLWPTPTRTSTPATSAITGRAWIDLNRNQQIDEGEVGIPAVPIRLVTGDGNGDPVIVATARTNADGSYRIENISTGAYLLIQTVPPGYLPATDAEVVVRASENGGAITVNFGNWPTHRSYLPLLVRSW